MRAYLKIVLDDGKSMILRDPSIEPFAGGRAYIGIEVNKRGDEVSGRGFDERKRIVDVSRVSRAIPMVMNNTYAELEPES